VFHVKHEGWIAQAAALKVEIDDRQAMLLDRYEELLRTRAAPLGMVATSDLPRLRDRHILDCLRVATHVHGATSAVDMGSGAGLPGIPLAIAVPSLVVTLVEARRNRAAFLELASDALVLPNIRVVCGRIEDLGLATELVTARAFAGVSASWAAAEPILAPGGRLVYFAGGGFDPSSETVKGVDLALFTTPSLARSGPLVIMSRQ
jgi:16S rRNA (guanine527-N7)-methyltransferase